MKNYNYSSTLTTALNRWIRLTSCVVICLLGSSAFAQVTTNSGSGLNPTYPSLDAAVTALNAATISSPVVITLSGNETAPDTGYIITATGSVSNTITIQGSSSTVTAGVHANPTGNFNSIFKIIGGDYITIQNFTMQENAGNTVTAVATNTMTEFGVLLVHASATDGCQNNTIQNNIISLNSTFTNSVGIFSTSSSSLVNAAQDATSTAGTNSNNKIYGNTISNVAYGIWFICPPVTATVFETGNDVGGSSGATGNTITFGNATASSGAWNRSTSTLQGGIIFRNGAGNNIAYNSVTSNSAAYVGSAGLIGISISSGTAPVGVTYTANISNNTVVLTTTGLALVIGIDFGHGISTGTILGFNNIVTLNQNATAAVSAALTGIKANYASATNTLSFNSVTINQNQSGGATTGAVVCITAAGIGTTVTVNNNNPLTVVQNAPTGAGSYGAGTITHLDVSAASGTVLVNNNTITNAGSTIRSTGAAVGISHTSGTITVGITITNNTITLDRVAASGSLNGTNESSSPSTVAYTIVSNNITLTGLAGTTTSTGIATLGGASSTSSPKDIRSNVINISGANTGATKGIETGFSIGSITLNSITINNASTAITGIGLTGSSAGYYRVGNNNLSLISSGTSPTILGVSGTATGPFTIFSNTISANASAAAASAPVITGINVSVATNDSIFSNTIGNFTTGAGSGTATITGIVFSGGTTPVIYKNKIYDLGTSNTGASSLVAGIRISGGTTAVTVFNNLIGNLTAPSVPSLDAIRGINLTATSATMTIRLYYNTLYLNASGPATFGTTGIFHTASATATTSTLDLRNNIIINTSTPSGAGITSALRRSTAATLGNYGAASNNNLLYAGAPDAFHVILNDNGTGYSTFGPAATPGTFQNLVAPREAGSFSGEAFTYSTPGSFFQSLTGASGTFLHLVGGITTLAEGGASPITTPSITDDYDGNARGSAPDVGADEFSGITPAPTFGIVTSTPGTTTQCIATNRTIDAAITSPSAITDVTLNYSYNAVAQAPVTMTLASGSTTNGTWTGVISAPTAPSNATVTWSVTAVNSSSLSKIFTGTAYQDSTPTTQSSAITFGSGSFSLPVSWTSGNGATRVVFMNTSPITDPTNGLTYSANTAWANAGQQCVFNGTGNSVTVTGLTPSTLYHFRVYEVYCSAPNYLTSTATNNPNSFTTQAALQFSVTRTTANVYNSIAPVLSGGDGTGTLSSVTGDEGTQAVAFPGGMSFTYQGSPCTGFSIHANGYIQLTNGLYTAVTGSSWDNTLAGAATGTSDPAKRNVIAPFYDDLNKTAPVVYYKFVGNVATIEWFNTTFFGLSGPQLYYQIVLNGADNSITFKYGDMQLYNGTQNLRYSYTCGLSGAFVSPIPQPGQVMQQQYENTTFFTHENGASASRGANGLSISPEPRSNIKFTPGTYVPVAAPSSTPPANDEFFSATELPALTAFPNNIAWNPTYPAPPGSSNLFTTRFATTSGEAFCGGSPNAKDVWFTFTANDPNMQVKIYASGGFIPRLEILDAGLSPLAPASCQVGTQGLTVTANLSGLTVNAAYYARVYHENSGVTATATATVSGGAVTGLTFTTTGTNYSVPASAFSGYNPHNQGPRVSFSGGGGEGAAASLITPTTPTQVLATMNGSNFGFVGGAGYTSAPTVTIESPDWGITGEFGIIVFAKAANDECASAINLTNLSNTTCVAGQNARNGVFTAAATASLDTICPGTSPDDDVWYKFTAVNTNTSVVVVGRNGFDPAFEVINAGVSPGNCATQTPILCRNATGVNGTENSIVSTIIGNTYLVRVYHAAAGSGGIGANFDICVKNSLGDASMMNIYSLGKLPKIFGANHLISARVRNTSTLTLSSLNVTVNVTGANTFSNVQSIPTLAPGDTAVVTFAGFTPTNLGTDTIRVTLPNDDDGTNNSMDWIQVITQSDFSYKDGTIANAGGVGFNGFTGTFVSKFTTAVDSMVASIKVDFTTSGNPYKIGIWDNDGPGGLPGTLLYSSSTRSTTIGTDFVDIPNVPVSGSFYAGVMQLSTTNVGYAYQNEVPIRSNSIYYVSPFDTTNWTDLADQAITLRPSIELTMFAPVAPNCVMNLSPANLTSTCGNSMTISWTNGGNSPTGYDVYFDAGAGPATTLVSSNQPGTTYNATSLAAGTYSFRIEARNAYGVAAGCENRTFTIKVTPVVTVSPTSANAGCINNPSTIHLVASGADTYSWSPTTNLDITTGDTTNSTPTANRTYTVTGTLTSTGCTATATAVITVNPAVNLAVTATPANLCVGASSQLLAAATLNQLDYAFANSTVGSFTALAGATVVDGLSGGIPETDDALTLTQPIGFSFNFGGASKTHFKMNTNGWMTFDTASTSLTNYTSISGTVNNIVAGFSRDLITGTMSYLLDVSGGVGNRILKLEWSGISSFSSTTVPATGAFQIWLFEGSNKIEIHYDNFTSGGRTVSSTAQAGIRSTSTAAVLSASGTTWTGAVANNNSANSVTISTSVLPAAGRVFTFTVAGTPSFTYLWSPASYPSGSLSSTSIANPVASNVTANTKFYVTVSHSIAGGCTKSDSTQVFVNPLTSVTASGTPAGPSNYTFTNTVVPGFTALAGATAVDGLNGGIPDTDDGISVALPVGFNFKFSGTNYSYFKMNTNGWITLDTSATSTTSYASLSGTVNRVIAGFSRDLETASMSYLLDVSGGAGNRILKVQWSGAAAFGTTTVPEDGIFQIWLYETTNVIEVRYGAFSAGARTGASTAQAGLHGSSTAATQILAVSGTTWTGASTTNTSSSNVTISTSVLPDANRVYRFTPPAFDLQPLCLGDSTVLTSAVVGGGQPYHYLWNTGNPADTLSTLTIHPAVGSSSYSVTVTDNCNASLGSNTVTIQTYAIPTVTITTDVSEPLYYCGSGGSGPVALHGNGASAYSWAPATGLDFANVANVNASPSATTQYVVTGTTNGCSNRDTISVFYSGGVAIASVTSDSLTGCAPLTTQLHANAAAIAPYCASTHSSGSCGFSMEDAVFNVTLNTLSNPTTCEVAPGYSDFTAGPTTTLNVGSNPFTLSVQVDGPGTLANFVAGWIDYDQDGAFNSTTEFLGSVDGRLTAGTGSLVFSVPASAYNGATRLRVIGGNDSQVLGTQSCGASSSGFGETEDYTVTIAGGITNPSSGLTYAWTPSGSLTNATTANPTAHNLPVGANPFQVIVSNSVGCKDTGFVTVTPFSCGATVNVRALIQNYYAGGGKMVPVLFNQLISGATEAMVDTVTIEARDMNDFHLVDSYTAVMDTGGNVPGVFTVANVGTSYYLGVRHHNSLFTVSADPVLLQGSTSYNFKNSAASAYGVPYPVGAPYFSMYDLGDGYFAIYNGDVNQDEYIDTGDVTPVDNDNLSGLYTPGGYWNSDINGDGYVDTGDVTPVDNNNLAGVYSQHP